MKKRSFFERLAGNLRFNEVDDESEEQIEEVRPARKVQAAHTAEPERSVRPTFNEGGRRELPITNAFTKDEDDEPAPALHLHEEEEIGQLPVDVYETPHEVIIQTLIAGVLPEHLKIDITRDVISISGKREENKAISQDSYHIQELYWGSFERVIDLPVEVEIDNAEAIERHGLLMIKLPKLDKGRKAALKIKSI